MFSRLTRPVARTELVTAMADGKDLAEACRIANAVAALCATRTGTAPAMPYRDEIAELLLRS
jgi:ribokinase